MEKAEPVSARELMALAVVMAVALLLRLRHFDMLLPWFVYLDETRTTEVALYLVRNCTIDTSYTFYPALAFYVNAIGFLGWAVFGHLGTFLAQSADAVFALFNELSARQPEAILVSRGVSLTFAMGSIVFTHLLARQYLEWRWALACTLLVALNSMHISVSVLAKVDAINLFWICGAYYAGVKYWRGERLLRWLVPASVLAGFSLVTKNNYQLCVAVGLLALMNGLQEKKSWYRFVADTLRFPFTWSKGLVRGRRLSLRPGEAQVWVFLAVVFAAAFIGSPYSFIRIKDTLVTAGWLYKQSEIISTYHTDPHVWWLDRYYYLVSIVLPFVFGLPVFWIMAGSLVRHVRKYALVDPYIQVNFIWFIYIFASQSGGPSGGAFPYYLFLNMVPLGVLITMDGVRDLWSSTRRRWRYCGVVLFFIILITTVLRTDSFRSMFYEEYNKLGGWLAERVEEDDTLLMVSVYEAGAALGPGRRLSVWPHELVNPQDVECEMLEQDGNALYINGAFLGAGAGLCQSYPFRPEVLVIDGWLVGGFRKVYRESWVAPYLDTLMKEQRDYRVVKRFRPDYFNRIYYASLDPEHDVEIVVLERKETGPDGERDQ